MEIFYVRLGEYRMMSIGYCKTYVGIVGYEQLYYDGDVVIRGVVLGKCVLAHERVVETTACHILSYDHIERINNLSKTIRAKRPPLLVHMVM